MKYILGLGMLVLIGVMGWKVGERMDPQAVAMALGVLFGIMASIPAALIVMAAKHSGHSYHVHYHEEPDGRPTFIVHTAGEASAIDDRLRPTGTVTEDGYVLYRGPGSYPPSAIVRDHSGYSIYRDGNLIAMKENQL